jgi:small GTP-binding protein
VPLYYAKLRPMVVRGDSLIPPGAGFHAAAGREARNGDVPDALARLQPLHRRDSFRRRHHREDHRRNEAGAPLRAREPRDRSRSGRLHGDQEARGLLFCPKHASGAVSCVSGPKEKGNRCASPPPAASTTARARSSAACSTIPKAFTKTSSPASPKRRPTAAAVIDLALLTDGLRAEREQGITIDVAYRYFSTPKRKFIIADTPGHEQYTRNMATGASTADLAIILIDARNGVLPQSRRHAFIANLLGIKHFVVAINKMDLVGFDEPSTTRSAEFTGFLNRIGAPERALHSHQRARRR